MSAKQRVTIYLPSELAQRLRVAAAVQGKTMSGLVEDVLQQAVPAISRSMALAVGEPKPYPPGTRYGLIRRANLEGCDG